MTRCSWWRFLFVIATVAVIGAEAADGDFELPAWDSKSKTASFFPEAGLWPSDVLPEKSSEMVREASALREPTPSEKRLAEYVLLQRKKDIEPVDSLLRPEKIDDLPPLDEAMLGKYFGSRPDGFLIDPQGLITEQKANDVLRFLEYHSEDSRWVIFPVVLGHHQEIPESIDLHQLHEEWFGAQPAILLVYRLLNPESLQIIYNQSIIEKVPAADLDTIRGDIIREASLAGSSADQLEKIAIEMSIQAFVLEKLMEPKPQVVPSGFELTSMKLDPPAAEIKEEEMTEVIAQPAEVADLENLVGVIKDQGGWAASHDLVKWVVAGSALILLIASVFFLKRFLVTRMKLRNDPFLFPSYNRQERLGGEFSGGAFVGISFEMGRSDGKMN
jgi:hypothetical protein